MVREFNSRTRHIGKRLYRMSRKTLFGEYVKNIFLPKAHFGAHEGQFALSHDHEIQFQRNGLRALVHILQCRTTYKIQNDCQWAPNGQWSLEGGQAPFNCWEMFF